MPDIEVYRCPNCGGLLKDRYSEKCEYCGAVLVEKLSTNRTDERYNLHQGEIVYLNNLPGVPITIETDDIPFQPNVIYDNLPEGKLNIKLRGDADEIVSLVEKTQIACNEEDLELYTSTISTQPQDLTFFNKAEKGAVEQFMSGDMKRYTVSIDFISLTPELAKIDVKIETIVFQDNGQTSHLQVTFTWSLRKYNHRWFVVNSSLKIPKLFSGKGISKTACIIPLIGLIIGIIAAIVSIIISFRGCEKTSEVINYGIDRDVKTVEMEEGEVIQDFDIEIEGDPSSTPLVIYERPDFKTEPKSVIIGGGDYTIIKKRGDWSYIRTADGIEGWTPTMLLENR